MRNNTYVDNVLIGANSIDEANNIYKEAKGIFYAASMNLREWTSNSEVFLNGIPEKDRVSAGITKVLGIKWNTVTDTLSLACMDNLNKMEAKTKRDILKITAQVVFDPLGLFLPATVKAKLFLRSLWIEGLKWDDILLAKHVAEWTAISSELTKIPTININRKLWPEVNPSLGSTFTLLCSVDASKDIYAAVAYIHVQNSEDIYTRLLFSKGPLSPQKATSMPRLELMAMLIGVRCINFITKELRLPIKRRILWSDSQCALHWLHTRKPLPVFVNNRVKEIREQKGIEYRYVNTSENPADFATRGKSTEELTKLWWEGPEWLRSKESSWPEWNMPKITEETLKACNTSTGQSIMFEASLLSHDSSRDVQAPFGIDGGRYSSLQKLLRVTAWGNRFVEKAQKKGKIREDFLVAEEIAMAKKLWELYTQRRYLPAVFQTLKSGKESQLIIQLGLFIDEQGLIRSQGRLSQAQIGAGAKMPKLLPKEGHFTQLVFASIHKSLCHVGVSHTLSQVRAEYWILQGRSAVKKVLSRYRAYKKYSVGPYQIPQMPDLPKFRVTESVPFWYTGLDYIGPLFIKEAGAQKKVWVCLFTCVVVRAIHMEIVTDMSADQFSMALRRFIARRGKPNQILCDNAPHFKTVKTVVDRLWRDALTSTLIEDISAGSGIKWRFITELAPWMGGYYERLVGVVKQSMRRTIGKLVLTKDQLQTLLSEIEASVNSRPLTFVGDDIRDGKALSPSNFLCLSSENTIPMSMSSDEGEDDPDFLPQVSTAQRLARNWKRGEAHVASFWKVWTDQYLLSLSEQGTSQHKNQPRIQAKLQPKIGEAVLVKEPLLPRGRWKIGRIKDLLTGADARVPTARILLPSGKTINRSVGHLYPLECQDDLDYKGKESISGSNSVDSGFSKKDGTGSEVGADNKDSGNDYRDPPKENPPRGRGIMCGSYC